MPVTTRSASKKNNNNNSILSSVNNTSNPNLVDLVLNNKNRQTERMIHKTTKLRKELLEKMKIHKSIYQSRVNNFEQVTSAYEIGKFLDRNLLYTFTYNKGPMWQHLPCVIYNKAVEFLDIVKTMDVSETQKCEFTALWSKIKRRTMEIIINVDVDAYYALNNATYTECYERAITHINSENGPSMSRSGRVKLVDYTGMDTIEPTDEDDGITDIWYDESIHYDEDWTEGDL
jgi:hypothetical protein